MNVGIVGGGAVGLTAAHDLAVRGADVTLFEKGTIPNDGESTSRAAGVLYDAFAAPEDAHVSARAIERFHEFSGTAGFEFV
jgi:sarcosine oxidase subunit beta